MSDAVINQAVAGLDRFRHIDPEKHSFRSKPGLSRELIHEMSREKNEPKWMLKLRLKSFEAFERKPVPTWGPDLSGIDFDALTYYLRPTDQIATRWEDLPQDIKDTFDKL